MRLILVVLLASCTKNDRPPPELRSSAPESRAQVRPPVESVAKPSADMPTWVAIDTLDGEPAKPTAWKPDGRPTLVVFSASWCPGCTASALADRVLVREHGNAFQVGIALQESNAEFEASPYAQALSGVPVWSDPSTKKLTAACHPVAIPSACLFEDGEVRWTGGAADASGVLAAHRAGKLDEWLAADDTATEAAQRTAKQALGDPSKISEVVALTHGRPDWQNSVAWNLVDRDEPSENAVALALALARDAVAFDGGIDFAHLDTYALALAKAGRIAEAAYVGERVLAVCKAVQGSCREERTRALDFIEQAKTRGG